MGYEEILADERKAELEEEAALRVHAKRRFVEAREIRALAENPGWGHIYAIFQREAQKAEAILEDPKQGMDVTNYARGIRAIWAAVNRAFAMAEATLKESGDEVD